MWQFTPYALLTLAAAVLLVMLAGFTWPRRDNRLAATFLILTLIAAFWAFTYTLEILSTTMPAKLMWVKLQWISIVSLPVVWLIFVLLYTGHERLVTPRNVLLALIVPAVSLLLAWTTPRHGLIYDNIRLDASGPYIAFVADRGWGFWLHAAYAYACLLLAAFLLFQARNKATGSERQRLSVMLFGALLPFLGNAVYLGALALGTPIYLDLTVLAFSVSALYFGLRLFQLRLIGPSPELPVSFDAPADVNYRISVDTSRERMLNIVALSLMVGAFFLLIMVLYEMVRQPVASEAFIGLLPFIVLYVIVLATAFWRTGSYVLRALGILAFFIGLGVLSINVRQWPEAGMYLLAAVVFGYLLFDVRISLAIAVAGLVAAAITLRSAGPELSVAWPVELEGQAFRIVWLAMVVALTAGSLILAEFSLRRDARTLFLRTQRLARELTREREQLEARVAERTRALETGAALSRRLSTILDQRQLVRTIIEQLGEAFNYYHVHIYLWNDDKSKLMLVGGTGEAGRNMLAAGHGLRPDQGLVGRAARTNSAVIVPDVSRSADWLPNPLLPQTRAEIAVPITFGGEVLGVLDVQQTEVDGLGPEDAQLIQAAADQAAVALRNARLVADIQHLAQQEALINAINQRIVETTDVSSAIEVAMRELSRSLGLREVTVRLQGNGGTAEHERH